MLLLNVIISSAGFLISSHVLWYSSVMICQKLLFADIVNEACNIEKTCNVQIIVYLLLQNPLYKKRNTTDTLLMSCDTGRELSQYVYMYIWTCVTMNCFFFLVHIFNPLSSLKTIYLNINYVAKSMFFKSNEKQFKSQKNLKVFIAYFFGGRKDKVDCH